MGQSPQTTIPLCFGNALGDVLLDADLLAGTQQAYRLLVFPAPTTNYEAG
ncbi:hypothetical protein NG798_10895 [Ancylothrix sp. C2]|nr:hypothetical protein [Ancylothrix sp. D3o]MCT7950296.1 hypothetical protein [Ancylothrix sp. D3o]